jgi:hypothetical protein
VGSAVARTAETFASPRPETLGDALAQEERIARAGGTTLAPLDPDEAEYTRAVLADLLGASDFPTLFAALMGDAAARDAGYTPLGLSDRAGVAARRARRCARQRGPTSARTRLEGRREPRPGLMGGQEVEA